LDRFQDRLRPVFLVYGEVFIMEKVKAYEISEEEFADVTGGIEKVQDLFSWAGFFFSQSDGFKGNKLYYAIHHFLVLDKVEPKYFLITKDMVDEIKDIATNDSLETRNELMLSLLIEYGILKI
jgi:hypothetical protein